MTLAGILVMTLQGVAIAQDKPSQPLDATRLSAAQTSPSEDKSPITVLGSEYQNSLELLRNRFRIDYTVDEITMVFFREYGSAPIVLVKPDGTKIFQAQADGTDLFWFDTATYDMISLKNPTPGPWQAVGQILPNSRIMVISDIVLRVEPLPKILFSGEILKQTAYLTNHGERIDYTAFRDVVELNIKFASTNNPNYNNFGSETKNIATFEDNGKGMDERPLDGVFTGQFNLSVADGEWTPIFSISTPMFTREQVDPNLMLLPNPIKVSVVVDEEGNGYHNIKIDADREHVDMSTLLLDGKVRFPNGDIQNFSITDMSNDIREHSIVNYELGVYRIKLTAYGNTTDGREFILDVPEFSFLTEAPEPEVVLANENGQGAEEESVDAKELSVDPLTTSSDLLENEHVEDTSVDSRTLILIVVLVNLFIIVVGGGAIWYFTRRKLP